MADADADAAAIKILSFRSPNPRELGLTVFEARTYAAPSDSWGRQLTAPLTPHYAEFLKDKDVCFIVHGFNVTLDHGVRGQGAMADVLLSRQRLRSATGQAVSEPDAALQASLAVAIEGREIVPVVWPGDGIIGWSYFTAFNAAHSTGDRFADFLLNPEYQPASVSFISHSLGARVVLRTIARVVQISNRRKLRRPIFDCALLTAAAVDDVALDDSAFADAVANVRNITVLSSKKDKVLSGYFPAGDAVEGALWTNYKSDSRALGFYGPKLKPNSPARSIATWYDITPQPAPNNQDHDGYFPWPWDSSTTWHDGWDSRRARSAAFYAAISNSKQDRIQAELGGWGQFKDIP